jgi:hypothetical protein
MKNFQNKTKIIKVSKVLRKILFAGLVMWKIGIPVSLGSAVISIFLGTPAYLHSSDFYSQCGMSLLMVFYFIVNLYLFRFFDRLKNGHLFDAQTVGNLDVAGKWWLVLWLLGEAFSTVGNEVYGLTMNWEDGGLFTGLAFIFVAWLLKEAQELQEEQELTV